MDKFVFRQLIWNCDVQHKSRTRKCINYYKIYTRYIQDIYYRYFMSVMCNEKIFILRTSGLRQSMTTTWGQSHTRSPPCTQGLGIIIWGLLTPTITIPLPKHSEYRPLIIIIICVTPSVARRLFVPTTIIWYRPTEQKTSIPLFSLSQQHGQRVGTVFAGAPRDMSYENIGW